MKLKRKSLIFSYFFLLAIALGCKDDESPLDNNAVDNRPPEEVVETLGESLAAADSISTFTEALKTIVLSQEDVAQGLTIFAPLNDALPGNGRISSNGKTNSSSEDTPAFTEETLKDHIIKGVLKFPDLTDGTTFTSLSGKTFKITQSGEQTWINGVLILPKELLSGTKETVFAVKSILTNTSPTDTPSAASTAIQITVWDASQWSPENPKGIVSAGADVVLYRSHEDYTNSNPAYELKKTGENGKVTFSDVEPGTYYIEVSKNNLSNIFAESEEQIDGLYVGIAGDGIFQSQEEIENAPFQSDAAPGKVRRLDANGDGKIDEMDLVPLPYESVSAASSKTAVVEIMISVAEEENDVPSTPQLNEEEIDQHMNTAASKFAIWNANLAVVDGLLSDDADTPPAQFPLQGAQELDNFTFTPNNPTIAAIWTEAYSIINSLNLIIANEPNDTKLLANAIGLRAYIYLRLTSYFGRLPVSLEYVTDMMDQYKGNTSQKSEVINFVISELNEAKNLLGTDAPDKSHLDATSINALLAEAVLLNKDYSSVYNYTTSIINSTRYELSASSVFDHQNPETIWGTSENLPDDLAEYFNQPILAYARLTEVYLMHAEASINIGNLIEAKDIINILLVKSGSNTTPATEKEELMGILRSLWRSEVRKEGNRFLSLIRWELANEILNEYEKNFIPGKSELLPIPQYIIDGSASILQNPGY